MIKQPGEDCRVGAGVDYEASPIRRRMGRITEIDRQTMSYFIPADRLISRRASELAHTHIRRERERKRASHLLKRLPKLDGDSEAEAQLRIPVHPYFIKNMAGSR